MYDKILQENQDKIERLKHEAKKYSELGSEYETSLTAVISLAQRAEDIFKSSEVEEKRLIVRLLFQNPLLDGRKPLFNLRSPFDLVLDLDDSSKWLPGADSFFPLIASRFAPETGPGADDKSLSS